MLHVPLTLIHECVCVCGLLVTLVDCFLLAGDRTRIVDDHISGVK